MSLKFTPERQSRFIEDQLREWDRLADRVLRSAIRKREGHVPEETISNLKSEIYREAASLISGWQLSFQDSARHVDMRRLDFSRRPIEQGNNFLLEWAKKYKRRLKGPIPGYKKGANIKLDEDQQLERIASAIIVAKSEGSRAGRRRRRRRGRWYNKTIYKLTNRLTRNLTRNQAKWLKRQIAHDLDQTMGRIDFGQI